MVNYLGVGLGAYGFSLQMWGLRDLEEGESHESLPSQLGGKADWKAGLTPNSVIDQTLAKNSMHKSIQNPTRPLQHTKRICRDL